jgi:hypothetical protein
VYKGITDGFDREIDVGLVVFESCIWWTNLCALNQKINICVQGISKFPPMPSLFLYCGLLCYHILLYRYTTNRMEQWRNNRLKLVRTGQNCCLINSETKIWMWRCQEKRRKKKKESHRVDVGVGREKNCRDFFFFFSVFTKSNHMKSLLKVAIDTGLKLRGIVSLPEGMHVYVLYPQHCQFPSHQVICSCWCCYANRDVLSWKRNGKLCNSCCRLLTCFSFLRKRETLQRWQILALVFDKLKPCT